MKLLVRIVGWLCMVFAGLGLVFQLQDWREGHAADLMMGFATVIIFGGGGALMAFGRRAPTTRKKLILRTLGWVALAFALIFAADGLDELRAGRTGDSDASIVLVLLSLIGSAVLLRTGRVAPAPAPPEPSITRPVPQRIIKPDDDFI